MLTPTGKRRQKSQRNPQPADRRRWFLHVGQGLDIEDIAQREEVSVATVQASIDCCKEYRFRNSNDSVALAVNEQVLALIPKVGKVFAGGLEAVKHIAAGRYKNGSTRFIKVDDVNTRLKTIETMKSLQEIAQPKAPLVQNNTQFNNNVPGGQAFAPGMSFEAKLRKIREARGLSNDDVIGITDSAADADVDQSVEEELSDIGIEIDDTEDGEVVEESE